jgi:hypothetical protein
MLFMFSEGEEKTWYDTGGSEVLVSFTSLFTLIAAANHRGRCDFLCSRDCYVAYGLVGVGFSTCVKSLQEQWCEVRRMVVYFSLHWRSLCISPLPPIQALSFTPPVRRFLFTSQ